MVMFDWLVGTTSGRSCLMVLIWLLGFTCGIIWHSEHTDHLQKNRIARDRKHRVIMPPMGKPPR